MRELPQLPQRVLKLALAERRRSAGRVGRLFQQPRGIAANVNTVGGGLAAQLRLHLGLDIKDRHRVAFLIVPRPAVYGR